MLLHSRNKNKILNSLMIHSDRRIILLRKLTACCNRKIMG